MEEFSQFGYIPRRRLESVTAFGEVFLQTVVSDSVHWCRSPENHRPLDVNLTLLWGKRVTKFTN